MDKEKLAVYVVGIVGGIAILIACIRVLIHDNTRAFTDAELSSDNFIEEVSKIREKALFDDRSGMPCDNPKQFKRWYDEYEQEASKEAVHSPKRIRKSSVLAVEKDEIDGNGISSEKSSAEVETEGERSLEASEVSNAEEQPETIHKYRIMGARIDEDLQERLFVALDEARIPYWYEIAVCQLFQESRGERFAISKDGRDHGIFQYRLQYWDSVCSQYGFAGASIYDADVQIRIYAQQMANRLNQGLSVDEVISRHKTSDEVPLVDLEYVSQVKQWLNKMEVCE